MNIKHIRDQARKESVQSGQGLKKKRKHYDFPMVSTNHSEYQSDYTFPVQSPTSMSGETPDYFINDYSMYKVTYDNNSTTVTEGDSGFSLTETLGTINPLMHRSYSHKNSRRTQSMNSEQDAFKRFVKKFKFAIRSQEHSSQSNFRHLQDIVNA